MNQGYGAPPAENHGLAAPAKKVEIKGPGPFQAALKTYFWGLVKLTSAGIGAAIGAVAGFCLVIAAFVLAVTLFFKGLDKYVFTPIKEDAAQHQQRSRTQSSPPPQRHTATASHKNTDQR